MKFICLHGSYGSAANFQVQLAPFIDAVEKNSSTKFQWINGFHEVDAPRGFDDYFGAPPLYKFIDHDGNNALNDFAEGLRNFKSGESPAESMRMFAASQELLAASTTQNAIKKLLDLIAEDPEIEGILGYSEGAMMAATLIMEEKRRFEEEGIPRRIKCGVFFAGWPPVRLVGDKIKSLLYDECDDVLDIPTCHIVGCKDPYIHGALALYEVSDPDSAELFDHGKGHTVPRDPKTINELADSICHAVSRSRAIAV
ncbi:hypothetical protein HIM_09694 [Hirsutella minnesotensis 3608]|uniref:Serine hydrolase domain-containing protein n=1 Tax=Hirsutella minnesotensis 3608 TaxID=1043627 RepID=A0A0F7ZGH5_9HYPO|nr:hypothetical protein HIM_09694 [Hirsutella minnesotensis 3608]